jgi:hypothetical protein
MGNRNYTERNVTNEIVGYIGTVTDITERKLAERREKSTKKWRRSLMPFLICSVDIEGRIYNYHARTDDLLAAPQKCFRKKIVEILPREAANICLATAIQARRIFFGYSL